jgi:hypothetical protein
LKKPGTAVGIALKRFLNNGIEGRMLDLFGLVTGFCKGDDKFKAT